MINEEEKIIEEKSFSESMNEEVVNKISLPTVNDLMEAGAQFGHKPEYTHPTMKHHIFGVMNGVAILNLDETVKQLKDACDYLENQVAKGSKILWVGMRKNLKEQIESCANRSGGYYLNQRWTPGLLTNFETVKNSLNRKDKLTLTLEKDAKNHTKKERLLMSRQITSINLVYGGLKNINNRPDIIVVLDSADQKIALNEAKKMKIPVVGICDSNADYNSITKAIFSNDDSLKSVKLISDALTEAIIKGVSKKVKLKPLGQSFKDRMPLKNNNFKPRDGTFTPRANKEGGFTPRANGGFTPRNKEGSFTPRINKEGGLNQNKEGFTPRFNFKPREDKVNVIDKNAKLPTGSNDPTEKKTFVKSSAFVPRAKYIKKTPTETTEK